MRYSAVLFDLDGTLVDSIPDLASSVNAMLVAMDYPTLSIEKITTFVGKGMQHLIWLALSEHIAPATPSETQLKQGIALFSSAYEQQTQNTISTIFDGVIEGLEAFKAAGCQLAVVTNKPIEFAPTLLEKLQLQDYFEIIIGGNSCAEKKPHPLPFLYACEQLGIIPEQALVIGDSGNDSEAARRAGIDVLLVPYGYNEGKNVQSLDCDGIVSSIAEAAKWAATR